MGLLAALALAALPASPLGAAMAASPAPDQPVAVAASVVVGARATGQGQRILRVSTASNGQQGNSDSSETSISGDGRYIAFDSNAANLVAGDTNNATDVFVVDTATRAVQRVSIGTSGRQALGGDLGSQSIEPALSENGRFVAFTSSASTLVPGDTNGKADIFVRDLRRNVTERISVNARGVQGNGDSVAASLSADGRYVAYTSSSDNLVDADGNDLPDVFVRDLRTKVTRMVSVDDNGRQGELGSDEASISADGRRVAFESFATDLVSGDTNGTSDIFVRDLTKSTTVRVSVGPDGAQTAGGSRQFGSVLPSISGDGRKVAFGSFATGLVAGLQLHQSDVYLHDLTSGVTQRIALGPHGVQGDAGGGVYPVLSPDGRYVAFASAAGNLVAGDTNNQYDVFVRDLRTQTTRRVTVGIDGGTNGWSGHPVPSRGARRVAFMSQASNLVAGDTNGDEDVFVR